LKELQQLKAPGPAAGKKRGKQKDKVEHPYEDVVLNTEGRLQKVKDPHPSKREKKKNKTGGTLHEDMGDREKFPELSLSGAIPTETL